MAKLTGALKYTGSLDDLSAYKMKGCDKIILRRKGGASKQRIKTDPAFEMVRRSNEEWKGAALATSSLIRAVYPVKHLSGLGYSGKLNGLCLSILADDKVNRKGRRSVLFSDSGFKVEGFGFNNEIYFDTLLRHPLKFSVNKNNGEASVILPELLPGINLYNPAQQPMYRVLFVLGAVPDIIYDDNKKIYRPASAEWPFGADAATPWYTWKQNCPAQTINLTLNNWQLQAGISLVLAAGIEFGQPLSYTEIRPVKYAGAAKMLKVV